MRCIFRRWKNSDVVALTSGVRLACMLPKHHISNDNYTHDLKDY
jgi:hypothetical protein